MSISQLCCAGLAAFVSLGCGDSSATAGGGSGGGTGTAGDTSVGASSEGGGAPDGGGGQSAGGSPHSGGAGGTGDGGSLDCILDPDPQFCPAPAEECLCTGCNATCDASDCVCAICADDEACGDPRLCNNDGVCEPLNEGCACADCAAHPQCG